MRRNKRLRFPHETCAPLAACTSEKDGNDVGTAYDTLGSNSFEIVSA